MREIWSGATEAQIWLQIELLAAEALVQRGLIPKKDLAQMKSRAAFNSTAAKN